MIENHRQRIRVHGTQYLLETLNLDDNLLIVDDVYSSGLNVQAVIERLEARLKRNMPADVRVAALYFKPNNLQTRRRPDYHLYECDKWLVLPYELDGLSQVELIKHKPEAAKLIDPSR